jgi:hypothetical protein
MTKFPISEFEYLNSNYEDPEDALMNYIIDSKFKYCITKFNNSETIIFEFLFVTINKPIVQTPYPVYVPPGTYTGGSMKSNIRTVFQFKIQSYIYRKDQFRKLFINDHENTNCIVRTISIALKNGLSLEYSYFFDNENDFLEQLNIEKLVEYRLAEKLINE